MAGRDCSRRVFRRGGVFWKIVFGRQTVLEETFCAEDCLRWLFADIVWRVEIVSQNCLGARSCSGALLSVSALCSHIVFIWNTANEHYSRNCLAGRDCRLKLVRRLDDGRRPRMSLGKCLLAGTDCRWNLFGDILCRVELVCGNCFGA